jgi:hypothetical protein
MRESKRQTEFVTPDEISMTKRTNVDPSGKKKKINKPLSEILGPNHKKLAELPNKSAIKYFDKPEEHNEVMDVLSGAFKSKPGKDYDKRLYGYKLKDFLASVHNPYRIQAQNDAAHDGCPEHSRHKIPDGGNGFWQMIYISHDSKLYLVFNVFITTLCLVSSYFYASLVGFRYSSNGEVDVNFHSTSLVFEICFLIHFLT